MNAFDQQATRVTPATDDLLIEAVQQYQSALDQGDPPDRADFLRRFPEIASDLAGCLDSLHFLRSIAPQLNAETAPDLPQAGTAPPSGSTQLGDFRILRELGRGGMGVVYEAEQLSIGRRVALKVLPFAAMLDRQQLNRFKNEARAAGTLDHPNIVAIHSVGCERGVHYYAMQLIEGQSLAEVIAVMRRGNPSPPAPSPRVRGPGERDSRDTGIDIANGDTAKAALSTLPAFDSREYYRNVAQFGIQAAEALDHAHQNGILHRDIKPANFMIDDAGKLWVTDFGLARLEADSRMTMTGDILGTLRYMSPEQALAKRVVVDHRSDIYSLGVTLYELLTLQPAYTGDDRQELLRKIAFEDPRPPRQINPHIPIDLQTIVLKAIEKEPADRYATAKDLADDLRAFLDHRPVVAQQPSLVDRARKWSRRHPAAVWATTFLLLATTLISAVSAVLISRAYQRESTQRQVAQQHLGLAQEAVDEMLTKVASTWVPESTATSDVQRQFLERALAIYQQLASNPPDGDPRGAGAALAHEKIADIQNHFGDFGDSANSLQTAVEICQELVAHRGAGAARSEQLARSYRKLASSRQEQSQFAAALDATDLGILLAERLVTQKTGSPQLQWELARLLYVRAELFIADGKLAEAAAAIDESNALVEARLNDPEIAIDDLVLFPQLANLQSTVLRLQGRLDEAAEIARPAAVAVSRMRSRYPDSKQMLEVDADLRENLGEVRLAQGDAQKAVDQFRDSLALRRQRLGGRTPTQQSFALMFDDNRPASWREVEPLVIADYCETQLRLAAALTAVGRPNEAECMLGDAAFNAQIINDSRRDILAFWVLHADAVAVVGEHLNESQSVEADHYLQFAAALWNEIRGAFPQAEQFRSGAHGQTNDWDWFRTAHPDYAGKPGTRESLKLNNWNTAFWNHMLGRAWFQNEAWDGAVNHFTKSAELRTSRQAYDWLHLAMAYHHLGQPDKAKTEYDRAVAQIQELETPDAELEALRRTAERLLAEDKTTDSN